MNLFKSKYLSHFHFQLCISQVILAIIFLIKMFCNETSLSYQAAGRMKGSSKQSFTTKCIKIKYKITINLGEKNNQECIAVSYKG